MVKKKRNVISSLYFNSASTHPFKDCLCSHKNWNRSPIDRQYYHIYDLKLWFESKCELGEELITKRVSENGKYEFCKHMKVIY